MIYYLVAMIFDYICENVVVWRTQSMSESNRRGLHVQEEKINCCCVFSKLNSGRENANFKPDKGYNEDDDSD